MTIRELAELVARVVGYTGAISNDLSKPDGTPRKLLDVSRLLALGWKPSIDLDDGVAATYRWYQENHCRLMKKALRHRDHRSGRVVPGGAAAGQGLRGARPDPARVDVQHASGSTTCTRIRTRGQAAVPALRRPDRRVAAGHAAASIQPAEVYHLAAQIHVRV